MVKSALLGSPVLLAALLLTPLAPAFAQPGPDDVDLQFEVDKAIKKGIAFLKGKRVPAGGKHTEAFANKDSLILLTYAHAGVDENDAHFQELLKLALEEELGATYGVCLTAMALEEIQRVKYQVRIYQCAQFLADNMRVGGTIRYGEKTKYPALPKDIATTSPGKGTETGSKGGILKKPGGSAPPPNLKAKPKVVRILKVTKRRPGGGKGFDHSNIQYLALGLRACHDSGIRFNPALISALANHLRKYQQTGGRREPLFLDTQELAKAGSSRGSTKAGSKYVAAPRGWAYSVSGGSAPADGKVKGDGKKSVSAVTGARTAGSVGALCICNYILGRDWRRDQSVLDGLQWLNKNFTVTENPGYNIWHYYYLYGLERAGMLYGTRMIGDHDWYKVGARYLLDNQGGGGGWVDPGNDARGSSVVDTCFAILFLKKATRCLGVETSSGR